MTPKNGFWVGLVWAGVVTAAAEPGREGAAPTFFQDVLPILQANCQECHRAAGANFGGMIAPMALTSYEEVRPWAKAIVGQVRAREMPPWDADPSFRGVFANERSLTEEEIRTIERWVEMGAPRGDPAGAPPPRTFQSTDGWLIGEPDLVIAMPEPYFVADDVADLYAAFSVELTEDQLPGDRWITAFQCKPDSPIIHHFNAHLLAPTDGKLPPPPGFPKTELGQIAPVGAGQYIGGTASGTDANRYPEGFGLLLRKGTRVTFDIHYHKEPGPGTGLWDRSEIGFRLTDKPPARQLSAGAGLLTTMNIEIPPGASRFQIGPVARTFRRPMDIVSLMPHMHLRGTAARFEAFYPDGTSEVLLHVPRYDFSWQTVYYYRELKRLPAGTRVEYTAWYDNTAELAAARGFDPAQTVGFGPASTDEMMMGFMLCSEAE